LCISHVSAAAPDAIFGRQVGDARLRLAGRIACRRGRPSAPPAVAFGKRFADLGLVLTI
jgi:hypothetical protein